jgi:hypothetical protein
MNRIARIIFTGVIAGLVLFVVGNATEILLSFFLRVPETTGKLDLAATILVTFLLDLIIGLLITFAYGIIKNGLAANRVFRVFSLALVLILINAFPRAADAYIAVPIPNTAIVSWFAGWILEAVLVSFAIVMLYPMKKKTGLKENQKTENPADY